MSQQFTTKQIIEQNKGFEQARASGKISQQDYNRAMATQMVRLREAQAREGKVATNVQSNQVASQTETQKTNMPTSTSPIVQQGKFSDQQIKSQLEVAKQAKERGEISAAQYNLFVADRERDLAYNAVYRESPESIRNLPAGSVITSYDAKAGQFYYLEPQKAQALQESVSYYNRIGYPEFGGSYAPLDIPAGAKLVGVSEVTNDGVKQLSYQYLPAEDVGSDGSMSVEPMASRDYAVEGESRTGAFKAQVGGIPPMERFQWGELTDAERERVKSQTVTLLAGAAVVALPFVGAIVGVSAGAIIAGEVAGPVIAQGINFVPSNPITGEYRGTWLSGQEIVQNAALGGAFAFGSGAIFKGASVVAQRFTPLPNWVQSSAFRFSGRQAVNVGLGAGAGYGLSGGDVTEAGRGAVLAGILGVGGEAVGRVLPVTESYIKGVREVATKSYEPNVIRSQNVATVDVGTRIVSQRTARANQALLGATKNVTLELAGSQVKQTFGFDAIGGTSEITTFGRVKVSDLPISKGMRGPTEISEPLPISWENMLKAKSTLDVMPENVIGGKRVNIPSGLEQTASVETAEIGALRGRVKGSNVGVDVSASKLAEPYLASVKGEDYAVVRQDFGRLSEFTSDKNVLDYYGKNVKVRETSKLVTGEANLQGITDEFKLREGFDVGVFDEFGNVKMPDVKGGVKPAVLVEKVINVERPVDVVSERSGRVDINKIFTDAEAKQSSVDYANERAVMPRTEIVTKDFNVVKMRGEVLDDAELAGFVKNLPQDIRDSVAKRLGGGFKDSLPSEYAVPIEKQFAQGKGIDLDKPQFKTKNRTIDIQKTLQEENVAIVNDILSEWGITSEASLQTITVKSSPSSIETFLKSFKENKGSVEFGTRATPKPKYNNAFTNSDLIGSKISKRWVESQRKITGKKVSLPKYDEVSNVGRTQQTVEISKPDVVSVKTQSKTVSIPNVLPQEIQTPKLRLGPYPGTQRKIVEDISQPESFSYPSASGLSQPKLIDMPAVIPLRQSKIESKDRVIPFVDVDNRQVIEQKPIVDLAPVIAFKANEETITKVKQPTETLPTTITIPFAEISIPNRFSGVGFKFEGGGFDMFSPRSRKGKRKAVRYYPVVDPLLVLGDV